LDRGINADYREPYPLYFYLRGVECHRYQRLGSNEMGIFDKLFKPNVEKLKKERNVNGLIKALRHKDSLIRLRAAEALGSIRDKKAVEPLIQALLNDEDPWVRRKAALALENIPDKRAVEPLIQALK
jgi:hypothetical protein